MVSSIFILCFILQLLTIFIFNFFTRMLECYKKSEVIEISDNHDYLLDYRNFKYFFYSRYPMWNPL